MDTAIISAEIKTSDIPMLKAIFKRIEAKKLIIKEKDDTEMTKEEFFHKIDKAISGNFKKMSKEERKAHLGL